MFPLLIKFAPAIVLLVEKAIKGGPEKLNTASQLLRFLAEKLKLTNPEVGKEPDLGDEHIRAIIEAVLAQLKESGQLNAPQASGDMYFLRGTVTPLKPL